MLVRIHRGLSKIWKSSNIQPRLVVPASLEGQDEVNKEILTGIYDRVLKAYKEKDLKSLQKWVEPGLYRKMVEDFNEVNKKGGVFEVDEGGKESMFYDFSLAVGVEIDRKLNFPKDTYEGIFTGEEIAKETGESEENLEKVQNSKLYVHFDAPTNAVYSLTMRSDKGVRAVENGEKNENEWFWIKFECEVLRIRPQRLAMMTGEFQALLKMLTRKEIGDTRTDWVITDINNTLEGNPYLTE